MLLCLIALVAGRVEFQGDGDLLVRAGATWQEYGDVAAGNALGSNILNLCLVLALGAVRCSADCRSGATSALVGSRR